MTQNLKKILFLLSPKEKKSLIYLLFVTLIMGFLNMIGIVSILPFMAVLTNPSLIIENEILKKLFEFSAYLGVNSNNEFLYFLGMGVFLLLFFSLSFNAFTIFLQLRFIQMCQWSISRRLFEKYINQPYSWFLNRNSANLEKTLLSEVSNVIVGGLTPMITLITRSILVILITILLFFTDPILACFIFTFFAFLYGLIYKTIRRYLGRIGKEKLEANRLRFLTLSEAFGAIKEVKASGLENLYLNRFSYSSKIFAYNQSSSQILVQLPRFFLESIAFGGMLLVILYLISRSGNLNTVIPIMSLYALAGYRLLPALQEVFSSISQLRFISPSLNLIYKDLTLVNNLSSKNGYNKLSFNGKLRLSGVCYGYPESSSVSLKNINIEINAYSKIGIIGTTGSGKTTLVDIILGLLEPQNGQIYIDGKLINKENLRFWQNSIGYVPQKVYLADSSIEKNIAFGVDKEKIDKKKIKKSFKNSLYR